VAIKSVNDDRTSQLSTTKNIVSSPSTQLSSIHDAAQQAGYLRQILEDNKLRIGCLLGAGCPLGVYDAKGEKSIVLIPAVVELTERVATGLEAKDKSSGNTSAFKKAWDTLCGECKSPDGTAPTVEDVLTELRTLTNRRGNAEVLGLTKKNLNDLDIEICSLVVTAMSKSLPEYRSSYNRFASWVGGRQGIFPVEIFTPNYDLLFEQAFEQHPLPHFDGFVGSREPWFDLASIEHDAIPDRWTRLWKLHGSINWEKIDDMVNGISLTRIVRVAREATAGKVMIHPSHLKYDQSRRMPYLAMLDRLRAFFRGDAARNSRTDNKGEDASRLVVCGYSFLDDHLNEVILDGLRGNRKAHCFALMYSKLSDHPRVIECAQKQSNLTVLARDGAVVGTRIGFYRYGSSGGDEHATWLYEAKNETSADPSELEQKVYSSLGDFHYFGLFIEQLCGGGGHNVC